MEENRPVLEIVSDDEYKKIEALYKELTRESGYNYLKLTFKHRTGDKVKSIGIMAFKKENKVYLGISNIRNFGQTEPGSLTNDTISNVDAVVRKALRTVDMQLLKFTAEESKTIYYPLNKAAAAGVIMAFYNGTMDPLDRIILLHIKEQDVETLLALYYLSCIKYIVDVEMSDVLLEHDGFEAAADEASIVPIAERSRYRELKSDNRPIPANHICLHALFGSYVLCRPVASKLDLIHGSKNVIHH